VLKTDKDRVSYALGMNLGTNLHRDSIDIDTAIFLHALKTRWQEQDPTDRKQTRAALTQLQTACAPSNGKNETGRRGEQEGGRFLSRHQQN